MLVQLTHRNYQSMSNITPSEIIDYVMKENVVDLDGITRVKQLKPSRFNFIVRPWTQQLMVTGCYCTTDFEEQLSLKF